MKKLTDLVRLVLIDVLAVKLKLKIAQNVMIKEKKPQNVSVQKDIMTMEKMLNVSNVNLTVLNVPKMDVLNAVEIESILQNVNVIPDISMTENANVQPVTTNVPPVRPTKNVSLVLETEEIPHQTVLVQPDTLKTEKLPAHNVATNVPLVINIMIVLPVKKTE